MSKFSSFLFKHVWNFIIVFFSLRNKQIDKLHTYIDRYTRVKADVPSFHRQQVACVTHPIHRKQALYCQVAYLGDKVYLCICNNNESLVSSIFCLKHYCFNCMKMMKICINQTLTIF